MFPDVAPEVPRPISPGPELLALRRFFPDVTWTGSIEAGGMGPGSPPMSARGQGVHRWIQDGRWLVGEYEQDQLLLDGSFVLRWQLHWVVGWDPWRREYRATFADNYGRADVMAGRLEGDTLTFESGAGVDPRIRLTWDAGGPPPGITWRNELSVGGSPWTLVEAYVMTPADLGRNGPRPRAAG